LDQEARVVFSFSASVSLGNKKRRVRNWQREKLNGSMIKRGLVLLRMIKEGTCLSISVPFRGQDGRHSMKAKGFVLKFSRGRRDPAR
jgi:hypothetical protein